MTHDIRRILEILPHRHPMVMVDRVLEVEPPDRIVALKNVSFNEAYFPGHFPRNPVMPGVLILEAMAQTGGILLVESTPGQARGNPYLVGVDKARFRRPVLPGDQLRLEVNFLASHGAFYRLRGQATVEGERAAEAEMLLAIMPSATAQEGS